MARIPLPEPGLVVRYDFLWPEDAARGLVSGKDRPACVVLVVARPLHPQSPEVILLPITHRPPSPGSFALELPAAEKHRLGLDDERSWIAIEYANREDWPKGLVPVGGRNEGFTYGTLSGPIARQLAELLRAAARARRVTIVPRP